MSATGTGGRKVRAAHPNAKLTEQQVVEIRASRLGPSALAKVYAVSKASISLIKSGKSWRGDVPPTPADDPTPVVTADAATLKPAGPADVERGASADTAMAARQTRVGFASADLEGDTAIDLDVDVDEDQSE